MNNIEKAKEIFANGDYTCVLVNGDTVYTSTETGVKPMLGFIGNGTELKGFSAADKIIGKAAALLFVYAGVSAVYADVMSEGAVKILEDNSVSHSYGSLTENIINRNGDGLCPMENAVRNTENPADALVAIRQTIKELRSVKNGN